MYIKEHKPNQEILLHSDVCRTKLNPNLCTLQNTVLNEYIQQSTDVTP